MGNQLSLIERVLNEIPDFERYYSSLQTEKELKNIQSAFRKFWETKIMTNSQALRTLEDLDPVIRMLDSRGKRRYIYRTGAEREELREKVIESGKQYGLSYTIKDDEKSKMLIIENVFSTAKCLTPMPEWYNMFLSIKAEKKIKEKLNQIFKELDTIEKASLIDELESFKTSVTPPQAVPLNAMLFCYDPDSHISVVSLNHRAQIIKAFQLGELPADASYGRKVVESNELIKALSKRWGLDYSPRKISFLLYWEPIHVLWKIEKPPELRGPEKEVTKHIETQYRLLTLGKAFACDTWVASNDRGKSYEGKRFSELTIDELPPLGLSSEIQNIIERIDVIWLRKQAIEAAFEIETSTSIYSGLLRLSDLISVHRNIQFPIYIVAPKERAKQVKVELMRPTFKGLKIDEKCKFIAIEDLEEGFVSLYKFGESAKVIDKIAKGIDQLSTKKLIQKKDDILT